MPSSVRCHLLHLWFWVSKLYQSFSLPVCLIAMPHGQKIILLGCSSFVCTSASFGSTLEGTFQFACQGGRRLTGLPPSDFYPRVLRHIVNTREALPRWSSTLTLPHPSAPLILSDHLPVNTPLARVQCPSAFTTSGWVSHPLSSTELGWVYDITPTLAAVYAGRSPAHLPWGKFVCRHVIVSVIVRPPPLW